MKCELSEEELFALVVSVTDRENIAKNFIPINDFDGKLITQTLKGLAALRTKLDTLLQQAESTHPLVRELEAQDDLRQELLRFCRFIEAQGYTLCRLKGGTDVHPWEEHVTFDVPECEELVEQALQADETDWFARAQHIGYAQDGGRETVFNKDTAISEIPKANVHEADALITDACYLLNMEADGELIGTELKEWRERWLSAAEDYLKSIGDAP